MPSNIVPPSELLIAATEAERNAKRLAQWRAKMALYRYNQEVQP